MRTPSTRQLLTIGGLALGALGAVFLVVSSLGITASAVGGVLLLIGWALLCILTIGERQSRDELRGLRAELSTHEARQLDRTRRIESAIEAERAKESKHEYVQERALERIEARVREVAAHVPLRTQPRSLRRQDVDVLFVTSNGAGLGHLTRLMAVANQLGDDYRISFLTLSRAYSQIANTRYQIRYFPSADSTNSGPRLWNTVFRQYLQTLFSEISPRLVVFDGTVVYEGLADVCRAHGVPLVWMQRGCWKPEADDRYPLRRNAAKVADHVIIPGDYGCDEEISVGTGVGLSRVGPIVFTREQDVLSKDAALEQLGLSPLKRHVLVSLGTAHLGGEANRFRVLEGLAEILPSNYQVTVVESPLASRAVLPSEVNTITVYPIARYLRAFEFTISAAGYNSVQEAVALRAPTIFLPNLETSTDDQLRRAETVADLGLALLARSIDGLYDHVGSMVENEETAATLIAKSHQADQPSGASESAAEIRRILKSGEWISDMRHAAAAHGFIEAKERRTS